MSNKVVVIGLDGATFDIIDPLLDKGKLPNLAKIINEGFKSQLNSSIPPVSAPAWVSFLTGKNPGKHGILGFQNYNLSKYNCVEHSIVSSNSYSKDTILDILTQNNKRSISFQVPLTYPAWEINGCMVSGYPTPDQTKAFTFPEEYSRKIGKLYEYKSDQIASGTTKEKVEIYTKSLDRMSNKIESLLKEEEYDLFIYVNNTTDWVQHKFWKEEFESIRPQELISHFYELIDEKIGKILNIIDEDTTLIIMSDHGAGFRPKRFLNINYLLRTENLLIPKKKNINIFTKATKYWFEWIKEYFPIRYWTKASFSSSFRENVVNTRVYKDNIDWDQTRAYRVPLSYPFVGINVNLEGRQENGIVSEGKEFNEVKNSVYELFKAFSNNNQNYIKKVFKQEELYSGCNSFKTPDIIVEINENYDSGSEIDYLISEIPPSLIGTISGYHRPNGILCVKGKNIINNKSGKSFNIIDIAPTILYLLGIKIPENIDGKVISEIFTTEFFQNNKPVYSQEFSKLEPFQEDTNDLNEDEEEKLMTALGDLGYL